MKIEVARRERSTNVRNVDTFKDFILSSKHLEGREGVRESGGVGDSFTLNWFSQAPFTLHKNPVFSGLHVGLFGTVKGSTLRVTWKIRLQYERCELPRDADVPASRILIPPVVSIKQIKRLTTQSLM